MKRILLILLLSITSSVASVQIIVPENTIQAIGYGNSEDEALKGAYQNAVEQYVGILVDSTTIIRNDRLIKNDILTFSNGYIDSYKKLSSKEQMGLWDVKIDAVIKKQNVLEKIKALNINPIDIKDSEQTYAKVLSQVKSKFDAEDMLVKLVKETASDESFQRYTNLRIDSVVLNVEESTRKYVPVTINYSIVLNWEEYRKITNKFEKLFENIGGRLVNTKEIDKYFIDEPDYYIRHLSRKPNVVSLDIAVMKNNKLYANTWEFPKSFAVIYPFQPSEYRWMEYAIDEKKTQVYEHKYKDSLYKHMQKHPYSLSIIDINKQVMWSNYQPNEHPRDYGNRRHISMNDLFKSGDVNSKDTYLMIFPKCSDSSDVSAIYKGTEVVNIDIAKLKNLKQVKISWDK